MWFSFVVVTNTGEVAGKNYGYPIYALDIYPKCKFGDMVKCV